MGVDVDLSQYCDIILLWNAAAMFFISFSTDYWEYRDFDYLHLERSLTAMNETTSFGWDKLKWRNIVVVLYARENSNENCSHLIFDDSYQFRRPTPAEDPVGYEIQDVDSPCVVNVRIYLFPEYANLFRECNDLPDFYRLELSRRNLLYDSPCQYFITESKYRRSHVDTLVRTAENLAFSFGCLSAGAISLALILGTCGSAKQNFRCVIFSGVSLAIFAFSYFLTTSIFLVKSQLLQNVYNSVDTNDDPVVQKVKLCRKVSLGWSFAAAVLSFLLSVIGAQVFVVQGKKMSKRKKSQVRRKRLEAALMSPCQQEVALALRAKMIVVQ